MAIGFGRGALDVAGVADGDQHLGVGDQVFELDFIDFVHDLRAAIVAVGFMYFLQLSGNDRLELAIVRQNLFEFVDDGADRLQFLEDVVDGELRQAMQLEFEDGIDLNRCEADGSAARNDGSFAFERADLVFAAIELDAGDFLRTCRFR